LMHNLIQKKTRRTPLVMVLNLTSHGGKRDWTCRGCWEIIELKSNSQPLAEERPHLN
jgi:hypothetical protein